MTGRRWSATSRLGGTAATLPSPGPIGSSLPRTPASSSVNSTQQWKPDRALGPSSTTTSDRVSSPGSPAAENRAATSNPNSARRYRARWRSPRSSRPDACENSAPAATTASPSSARNRAGTRSRRNRQNRPRSALPEADRRTHGPVIAASPTRSRSDRLADRLPAPSTFHKFRSAPLPDRESTKLDFVNGLVGEFGPGQV